MPHPHRPSRFLLLVAVSLVALAAFAGPASARAAEPTPTTTAPAVAPAESGKKSSAPLLAGVASLLVVVGGAGALYLRWARDQRASSRRDPAAPSS